MVKIEFNPKVEALLPRLHHLGFDALTVEMQYSQPHRFYHNIDHISDMIEKAGSDLDDELFLAIVYHDIVYDPLQKDNEEKSAELFREEAKRTNLSEKSIQRIGNAILATKHHKPLNLLEQKLIDLDLSIFTAPIEKQIEFEKNIFKEYQHFDFRVYKDTRLKILNSFLLTYDTRFLIDFLSSFKPNIGVYAGSFDPFHKGHLDILKQAERVFDKVIIARGRNPEKPLQLHSVNIDVLKYHQVIEYNGLLSNELKRLGDVTLIRGLRNSRDFDAENEMLQYLNDQDFNKVVYFISDKKYSHISSSAIRNLDAIGEDCKRYKA